MGINKDKWILGETSMIHDPIPLRPFLQFTYKLGSGWGCCFGIVLTQRIPEAVCLVLPCLGLSLFDGRLEHHIVVFYNKKNMEIQTYFLINF